MGSLSDYAELELLDHVCNVAYTPAATVYLALCTADPTDAGTGAAMNEVADANGYARKAITFAAAATRAIAQTGVVTFDAVTGAGYGPVTHWAVLDSGTHGAGNMLAHGSLSVSKTLVAGNTPALGIASEHRTESVFGDSGDTITGYRWEVDHLVQFIVDHRGYHIGAPTILKQRATRVPYTNRTENAGGTP